MTCYEGTTSVTRPPELSEATLFRMSRYLNVLELYDQQGESHVSTRKLADLLGVNRAVVKQDFLPLKVKGQTGVGYSVKELLAEIKDVFLSRGTMSFAIVGFGNIGQALANYTRFEKQGFLIRAVFDVNPRLHNYSVRGIPVNDIGAITEVCRERNIDIGVICTPVECAQETADRLIEGGVKGIWNFAPTELVVPANVILVHEHLTHGLLTISYRIAQRFDGDEIPGPATAADEDAEAD